MLKVIRKVCQKKKRQQHKSRFITTKVDFDCVQSVRNKHSIYDGFGFSNATLIKFYS